MKIKNNIQIFDDNNENINSRLCVFSYYYEIEKHPLDGVYGVSGAERDRKDLYMQKQYRDVIGFYNQDNNEITTVHGRKVSLLLNTLTKVKIIDINKLLKD
jgi:hypothetical protein